MTVPLTHACFAYYHDNLALSLTGAALCTRKTLEVIFSLRIKKQTQKK